MADVVPSIDVVTSFKSLANAVKDTDLYKESVANIDDAFNDNSLSAYEQTELKANFLANITNNALNSAMSLALQEQSANAKLTEELNLIKQQIQESQDKISIMEDEQTDKNLLITQQIQESQDKISIMEDEQTDKNLLITQQIQESKDKISIMEDEQTDKNLLITQQVQESKDKVKMGQDEQTDKNLLITQQIQESKDKIKIMENEQTDKSNLIDQQVLAEEIKNGGVSFDYIYYKSYVRDAQKVDTALTTGSTITVGGVVYNLFDDHSRVESKTLGSGTSKSIYEIDKEVQLKRKKGFTDNLNIKKAEHLGNTIFGVAAGGLVVKTTLWTEYFKSLNAISADTVLTIPTTADEGYFVGE